MSMAIPLGVRIFNVWGHAVDQWVTRLVDDISFRSVTPGGFANATFTLHNDQMSAWSEVAQVFNRVQIVDLRSQEIAWEGRIDTIRRQTDSDTWELGCLGSMAYASDIQIPVFYIDGLISSWELGIASVSDLFTTTVNEDAQQMTFKPSPVVWAVSHVAPVATWQKCEATGQRIGRWDITYSGRSSTADFRTGVDVQTPFGAATQTNVDLTAWNAALVRKSNLIITDFTSTNAQRLRLAMDVTGAGSATVQTSGTISLPRVQAQRVDETGAKLQTAASYPNDYVTVEQVVRDVVGRFLVGAWLFTSNNIPYHGHVGSEGIFIDTTATAQFTHLTYYDGTTGAQVLDDMMTAQPNAYWALWESRFGASVDGNADARFRFEWATWPLGYCYQATSIDGLEEQPDGGAVANLVSWQYPRDDDLSFVQLEQYWDTAKENTLLRDGNVTRAVTVRSDLPSSSVNAFARAVAYFEANQRTTNAGTLTIKRPIQAHDAGLNSNSGMSRMLDPWLIRPGKLIRITDIPPRSNSHTFAAGADAVIDTFGRTAASGWGSAESGQAWTLAGGLPASDFSVSSGTGKHSQTSVGFSRWTLVPAPAADFDMTATVATSVTPAGASHFVYLTGRWTGTGDNYTARVEFTTASAVALTIRKRVAAVETQLAGGTVATLTHAANRVFSVRLKASGSSLMAKIWLASAGEPTDWTFTVTDTDLTEIGSVGFRSLLNAGNTNPLPVVATFDNLTAVGLTAYASELDGTVFRVVGTTYSSADNSCVLELDQPPAWNTPTQVLQSGEGSSNLVVRG